MSDLRAVHFPDAVRYALHNFPSAGCASERSGHRPVATLSARNRDVSRIESAVEGDGGDYSRTSIVQQLAIAHQGAAVDDRRADVRGPGAVHEGGDEVGDRLGVRADEVGPE